MKKILLIALAAAGALFAKKKFDEGQREQAAVGRGDRPRRPRLSLPAPASTPRRRPHRPGPWRNW